MRTTLKRTLLTAPLTALVALLALGLLSLQDPTVDADVAAKRDDDTPQLVLVDDDDDDDTNDADSSVFTGWSRSTGDRTRSNFTRQSRDRDRSRSDKTRDWTRDGGDRTRDWTSKKTNDRSRNDTRR